MLYRGTYQIETRKNRFAVSPAPIYDFGPFFEFFRTATARGKAEQADIAAVHAREDAQMAVNCAKQFGGDPASLDQPLPSMETSNMMASKPMANNVLSVNTNNANSMANSKFEFFFVFFIAFYYDSSIFLKKIYC